MSCLDSFDSVFHVIDFYKLTVLGMWGCVVECENTPGFWSRIRWGDLKAEAL